MRSHQPALPTVAAHRFAPAHPHTIEHVKEALGFWMRMHPPSGTPRVLSVESSHIASILGDLWFAGTETVRDDALSDVQRSSLYAGLAFARVTRGLVPLLGCRPALAPAS